MLAGRDSQQDPPQDMTEENAVCGVKAVDRGVVGTAQALLQTIAAIRTAEISVERRMASIFGATLPTHRSVYNSSWSAR